MFIIEVSKCEPTLTGTSIKIVPYDGKSSWQVYNTQHSMVSEATSSRCDAADMLVTLSEYQRCDFEALTLDFCVGGKCVKEISWPQLKSRYQKAGETLQELATDIGRFTHLAYPDYSAEACKCLSLQYFII